MKQEYIEFFDLLGKHSQLSIKMLVPNKFPKLDTEIFACVCYQQMLLKKVVIDNMKECADKYVNSKLKQLTSDKKLIEFSDMDLSNDMENLIQNYLYFKNRNIKKFSKTSDSVSSDVITSYISYLLINTRNYSSYKFFKDCLYVKSTQTVNDELMLSINQLVNVSLPNELHNYGEFLTNPLFFNKYECFGRDKEIYTCIEYLSRLKKNNIILVGEAGVGKTSIVYGICNYLQSFKCPHQLLDFCVFNLNLNKLISGTTFRGDLEKRLDVLIDILKQNPNILVFIDEIHSLFSKTSGDGESAVIQNILKPYLSSNSRVIGCTTNKEYKIIESDKAFERRFSKVHVDELSIESTKELLKNCVKNYTEYYNKNIDDSVLEYVVDVSNKYIKNKYFPDKAFDVLDLSFVKCDVRNDNIVKKIDVEESVYTLSNISPNKTSIKNITNIENKINECVIGQNEAVSKICSCMKKYYIGVNDKTKPIGNFLFVGPTGVGKTELCNQIANHFFTKESFLRFDMSEFMEKQSVSKFIGSPPGYVGYSEGGSLTEKIKHLPFSIILFDEIEKAHIDVVNILLQIMDNGRLTDSFGNTVDFSNCLIIMTSNIGCEETFEKNSIGFSSTNKKQNIISAVKSYFSPEFRSRLNDIIVFNSISEDMYNKIFEKELNNFIYRYACANVKLSLENSAINQLRKSCYSEKSGVRFIQKKICNYLDDIVLSSVENDKFDVVISFDGNNFISEEIR